MDNTVCKQEDVCYNEKNGMIDVRSIEEIKKQLIRMFEALPDCVAAEVLTGLKERGIL